MRLFTSLMFLFFSSSLFSSFATAQIVFAPSFSYISEKQDDNGAISENKLTFYDFRLGYIHASGLYLGAMYSMTGIADTNNSNSGYAAGPTLGFSHYSGFYGLFTYYLIAEQNTSSVQKYTGGMGPQIDIGWAFPVTPMFHLGPQLSYRSVKYDKSVTGGVSTSTDFTRSNIVPAIVLWFNF